MSNYFNKGDCPAYRKEQKQISFAWKSGLILFGSLALFISLCIIGGSV